ncbi:DNA-dependent protein kinase catalytic subunit-like isoform X2 [Rhopilema esculentum]|uniref:DNA-dependent protein kinase catalytic subunit-like isoform X2 n=1 Tax=Rhopilema esculentum TaxID=499914 RepID=UPI0031DCAC02
MSHSLQVLLEHLQDILKRDFIGRSVEASNVVSDIASHCQDFITVADIEYSTSLLFNNEFGVLTFINTTVQLKEFENPKADLLTFLLVYLEKIGDSILPHVKSIQDACLLVVTRDPSSKLLQSSNKDIQQRLDVPVLAEKLFALCLQSTREASGVRGALFNINGVIAEKFPEHSTSNAERFGTICLKTLKQQMVVSKKPEFLVIGGCLRGLAGYLVNFTQSMEEGSKSIDDLFCYTKMAINPKVELSKYEVPKAALCLLEKHAVLFRQQITDDWEPLYDTLCFWSKHSNKDMKIAGLKAWDSCLKEISQCIVRHPKKTESIQILTTLLRDFHGKLNAESSDPKELSLAVKGFGMFAKACKMLLSETDVKLLFDEIMNKSQHLFSNIEYLSDETLQYLPTFLEALAKILQQIKEVSAVHLVPMERMVVILFENYPKLGKGGMFVFEKSLTHFIRALSNNTSIFKVCLSEIVYQGLIRTCSHPVVTEEGIGQEEAVSTVTNSDDVSFRSFVNLWVALLCEKNYRSLLEDCTKSKSLKENVYDELMQSVLLIAKKLNLSTQKTGSGIEDQTLQPSSDPMTGLVANVPKDFQIFINLVEFCRVILFRSDTSSFSRWIPIYVKEFITLSARYPLVSGFYKLLEIAGKICSDLSFFQGMTVDPDDLTEKRTTFLLLGKFVKNVLSRVSQFTDDLLSSCLQFVLSLPIEIVETNVESFAKPLQLALKLGLSHHPLAVTALNALEFWQGNLQSWKTRKLLTDVLPYFDGYLQISSDKSGNVEDKDDVIVFNRSTNSRRNRVPIKLLRALRDADKISESPISQFRSRVVQFLGNLGGSMNIDIIKEGRIADPSRAIAWDTDTHLSFGLPFWDMKPTIYLDTFLPRVIELATVSSDRQTKVVACELLHALTLFILGKSTQQANQMSRKEGMEGIYKHLFPALLKLGCDIEQVAEQLFRPLVFQMIHWFTSSPSKTESQDTVILLDTIMNGLVSQDNSALRDFSAKCIREFLEWSIKHTKIKHLDKSAVNPKAMFKRIYSMASHPNVYKRLGAAMAFNSIYVTFREHDELVDAYALELLTVFVESLGMAHSDEPGMGTVDQCKDAINHLERIIKQKSKIFFKSSKNRRIPVALKEVDQHLTLDHVFVWLLRQCGSPKTECRHKCMELLFTLLPTRPGVSHARVWFENTVKSDGNYFLIDRFEKYGQMKLCADITKMASTQSFHLRDLIGWYERYLASLDCYTWIASLQLVKPGPLLLDPSSVMLATLVYLIKELAFEDLESAMMKCFRAGKKSETHILTPMDKDLYNRSKCTAIVRTLDFLTTTLAAGIWKSKEFEGQAFNVFSKELHLVICKCILEPESIGFDIADLDVLQKLPEQMLSLCLNMKTGLPSRQFEDFVKTIGSQISKERYDVTMHLPLDLRSNTLEGNEKFLSVQQLTAGYQLLRNASLLELCMKPQEIKSLNSELMSNVLNGLLPLSGSDNTSVNPSQKRLAESMLQLALQIESEPESLVEILLDTKPVQSHQATVNLSPRGVVFYGLFRSVVNEYITHGNASFVSHLITRGQPSHQNLPVILQGIVEHVSRDMKKRGEQKALKSDAASVFNEVLVNWMNICTWWRSDSTIERKVAVLALLRCLLIINPQETLRSSGSNASPTLACFLQLLSDTNTGLAFKGQMFELLPQLLEGLDEDKRSIVSDALKRFMATFFPLCSDDLKKGGAKYGEYIGCLQKLFRSLIASSSHVLLDTLLAITVRETDDVTDKIISPSLKMYFERLNRKEAEHSLNLCFNVMVDAEKYPNSIRRGVMDRVLFLAIRNVEVSVVKAFFKGNMKAIMEKIESKLIKLPESVFEAQLVTKICCFKIIQSLFVLLPKDELMSKNSEIVKSYAPATESGKELTKAVTKAAHAARSEDCRGETMLKDLRRQYHCAAQNALCAVIANTQTEVQLYTGLLFTENPIKGQMLWENIIDNEKEYSFEAEQTVPFARKRQLQMIRRKQTTNENTGDDFEERGIMPYLSSQYLMNSSLSQELSQFDFSTPIQAYSTATSAEFLRSQSMSHRKNSTEEGADEFSTGPEEVLEMDEINKNECMPVLVSLLKHMRDSGVYSHPAEGTEGQDMPSWMKCLEKKMNSADASTNVKLFILKLIINEPKVFEPYGKFWFPVIVKFLISGEIKGACLNYFVIDIVVVMLSWSSTCIPEDTPVGQILASSLLDYMVKNCHHNNRAVLKNNLQVIKTLTSVWKERLTVPYKLVYEHFTCEDKNTKDNMTGIQLLGVLITNGFPPYLPGCGVDEDQYYTALTQNVKFKYKDVFASAAEVIGLSMKLTGSNKEFLDCPLFKKAYESLFDLQTARPDRFILCLYRVHLNYPIIVDKFIVKLLYVLPSLHGILKQQCLEILASRVEHAEEPHDIFIELKNKGLVSALNHRDEGIQLASLAAFNGLLKYLNAEEILPLADSITKYRSCNSVTLRQKMYDTFIWIYDTYRADEQTMEDNTAIELLKISKETLLIGINDNNTEISLKVLNFWRHETRLPKSTIERFIEILRALYSTKTEKEFLSYSTNLLLQLTSLSPDYNLPLFSDPLDSSKRFQDYHVNFSWQRQKIAMTPLFAASQTQSQPFSQLQEADSVSVGMIRETQQNLEFTPTQDQGDTGNWMNPSFQIGSQSVASSQSNLGSYLFASQSAYVGAKRSDFNKGRLGGHLKDINGRKGVDDVDSGSPESVNKGEILKLKRRIMKNQEKQSNIYFAIKQRRTQQQREAAAQRQKAARDHQVVMYRKYRLGELPDIQIKHSELIVQLQAAAQHDPILGRQLFEILFAAVVSELPRQLTEDVSEKAQADIQEAINAMINNSAVFYPPFIYALEDSCFKNEGLRIDASSVSTASATSLQHPMGILLLEKQLLEKEHAEPKSKRKRTESIPMEDIVTWTELAKLYKSIGCYDFVHSIFSSQISKDNDTRLALEAEARNDYAQALKLYIKVSSAEHWNGNGPSREEEEFWDIARLECYDNLGQWSDLRSLTLQCIDEDTPADILKIWDDVYLQEQFLPYYIRSNIKLLCHGKTQEVQGFDEFINRSLKTDEQREILESRYCSELALVRILQDDFGGAMHYINLGIQGFIEEWSHLNSLMLGSRLKTLSKLQCLCEMKEFAAFFSKNDVHSLSSVHALLTQWFRRLPDDKVHSMSIWDDVIANRCVYMKKIKYRLLQTQRSNAEEIIELLDAEDSKNTLLLADVARKQGNFAVAKKYLRDSFDSTMRDNAKENGLAVDWYHVYSKVDSERSKSLQPLEAVPSLLSVLEKLNTVKACATNDTPRSLKNHLLESSTLDCLAEAINNQDQTSVAGFFGDKQRDTCRTIFGIVPPMDKKQCKDFFHQYSYSRLHSALSLSNKLSEISEADRMLSERVIMNMVKFCDSRLREAEEVGEEVVKQSEYASTVVRYHIKAMSLDSAEGRQRFPRLLQIISRYPETRSIFRKKVTTLPSWMFLGWLNQVVALLDKNESDAIMPILEVVARDYPQALMFPLRISSEQFSFDGTPEGRKMKSDFERLSSEIKNPLCDEFIQALHQLTNPEHILKDWSDDMRTLLEVKRRDSNAVKLCFSGIWDQLFKPVDPGEKIRGTIRKNSSKDFSKKIQTLFGDNGSKIVNMPSKDFLDICIKLLEEMKKTRRSYNLKGYSPWFSTFHENQSEDSLEIPGQYTGKQKPLLEYHVRIAGFDERVLSMDSLRVPKRITIRGHDEKEYKFLVKGNEDLRLDQRIEQLFDIMNGILADDPACNSRSLKLKTYQVIPLTSRIGIIEWMENTVALRDLLSGTGSDSKQTFSNARTKYHEMIRRFSSGSKINDLATQYINAYMKPVPDISKEFEKIETFLPWDLLRRVFDRLSMSTEAFFVLRNHFIQTHACLCICQYVLGIGDRHLSNLMVDTTTGGIVGIDFGYSFGVSTTVLPIPELMPFRLTKQFRNLLLPLKDLGPYKLPMTSVMRALRSNSDILLCTMNIFVNEPLVDWQANARKQSIRMDGADTSANWYPKEKIEICKLKLMGVNSCYITGEELRLGKGKKPYFKKMLDIAYGNPKRNIRARLLEEADEEPTKFILTTEQQVACLIDQATDPNILGKTFVGWEPYV